MAMSSLENSRTEGDLSFSEKYELCQELGHGAFGRVWSCRERATREEYACKVLEKQTEAVQVEKSMGAVPKQAQAHAKGQAQAKGQAEAKAQAQALACLRTEIQALTLLKGQHAGILQLKEVLENSRVVQVVLEKCRGGDLFELLRKRGKLPEAAAKYLFRQVASALEFSHSKGIVHRDVKPDNILLDCPASCLYSYYMGSHSGGVPQVHTKLADFGCAIILKPGEAARGDVGTRLYTAPEVISLERYGSRADVWSLGVVLCTMLTGKLPFVGRSRDDEDGLCRAILRGRVDFGSKGWVGVSAEAKDLVRRMLEVDPQKRLEVFQVRRHPWCATDETLGLPRPGLLGESNLPARGAATDDAEELVGGQKQGLGSVPCGVVDGGEMQSSEPGKRSQDASPECGTSRNATEGKENHFPEKSEHHHLQLHDGLTKVFARAAKCLHLVEDEGYHRRKLFAVRLPVHHVS